MPEKPWVHLISQEKYDMAEIKAKLDDVFNIENIQVNQKTVLLKPSFVFPLSDKKQLIPINTNNTLITAVCMILGERGARKIYIAESETILVSRYAFDILEIEKDVKKLPKAVQEKIVFCYLDESYKEKTTPENPSIPDITFNYPKIVKDVDLFITLPKLKCNIFSGITLSAKNNIGLISTSNRLQHHSNDLHEMISDLWQIRPPEYIITDAIFAGEGQGPQMATPYPTNLLLFGNNGPAVDSISCELMGYDPSEIRHLAILHEKNYGPLDFNEIRIENKELIKEKKHIFERPVVSLENVSPNIKVFKGECCESGCDPFVRSIFEAWGPYFGWDSLGEINIIMGKDVHVPEEELRKFRKRKTLVYGDCAGKYKDHGHFIHGCPPQYMTAGSLMSIRLGIRPLAWVKHTNFLKLLKGIILFYISRLTGKKYRTV